MSFIIKPFDSCLLAFCFMVVSCQFTKKSEDADIRYAISEYGTPLFKTMEVSKEKVNISFGEKVQLLETTNEPVDFSGKPPELYNAGKCKWVKIQWREHTGYTYHNLLSDTKPEKQKEVQEPLTEDEPEHVSENGLLILSDENNNEVELSRDDIVTLLCTTNWTDNYGAVLEFHEDGSCTYSYQDTFTYPWELHDPDEIVVKAYENWTFVFTNTYTLSGEHGDYMKKDILEGRTGDAKGIRMQNAVNLEDVTAESLMGLWATVAEGPDGGFVTFEFGDDFALGDIGEMNSFGCWDEYKGTFEPYGIWEYDAENYHVRILSGSGDTTILQLRMFYNGAFYATYNGFIDEMGMAEDFERIFWKSDCGMGEEEY